MFRRSTDREQLTTVSTRNGRRKRNQAERNKGRRRCDEVRGQAEALTWTGPATLQPALALQSLRRFINSTWITQLLLLLLFGFWSGCMAALWAWGSPKAPHQAMMAADGHSQPKLPA